MKAIRHHEFGPAENLLLEELPDPVPAEGEVRIDVRAAGVHLIDATIRAGEAGPMPQPDLPTIPGREVAGRVDAVGPGVDHEWVGASVVAHLGMVPGGYASQAVTAANNLFRLPDNTNDTGFADAVALVGTGRTAFGIIESEPPTADDVVLVPSAAGGLGWLLVQAAQQAGARVAALPGGIPGLAGRALERLGSGAWRPLVTTYPLADAARAHADLERRRATGKVVLVP